MIDFYAIIWFILTLVLASKSRDAKVKIRTPSKVRWALTCLSMVICGYFAGSTAINYFKYPEVADVQTATYDYLKVSEMTLTSDKRDDVKQVVQNYVMGCTVVARVGVRDTVWFSELKTFGYPETTCEDAVQEFDRKE